MWPFTRHNKNRQFRGDQGPMGPMGPMGPQGVPGEPGRDANPVWTPRPNFTFEPVSDPGDDIPGPPMYAHDGDAGMDIRALSASVIRPGCTVTVSTGYRLVGLTDGWKADVVSRSGLAAKHSVHVLNSPGLIDPGYTGELKVILHNAGRDTYSVKAGERVAQLVISPALTGAMTPGRVTRTEVDRGDNGLGSTDVDTSIPTEEPVADTEVDMVNAPPHYTRHPVFPGEPWPRLRHLTAGRYAAAKYLWRFRGKNGLEDLKKAVWYLQDVVDNGPYVTPAFTSVSQELRTAMVDYDTSDEPGSYAYHAVILTIEGNTRLALKYAKTAVDAMEEELARNADTGTPPTGLGELLEPFIRRIPEDNPGATTEVGDVVDPSVVDQLPEESVVVSVLEGNKDPGVFQKQGGEWYRPGHGYEPSVLSTDTDYRVLYLGT